MQRKRHRPQTKQTSFAAMEKIPDALMGRLKSMPARLGKLPPRIGVAEGDKRGQDRQRALTHDWRGWYALKRWRDLRMAVFVRDGFICQRSGVMLIGKHPAPNSPVANHKQAHRGDPRLFWDINNIETVSKAVHDSDIQKEEQSVPHGVWD